MMKIPEVNWNNFKAKFNGKEQKCFELLCYLIFCSEFGQDKGIFRFKNQTGIETNTIKHEGEVIGWQAKFLETAISTKKEELKDGINSAKRKNPALTKILFYLNREFSESSKQDQQDPAYKKEIEEYGKSLGVKVEWRVPSHFEKQLALDKNRTLAEHFFSLGKSIVDFIAELQQHTESILDPIHSKIVFREKEIKIDRSAILKNLQNTFRHSSLAILSGVGGSGKTAVVKEFYDEIKDSTPLFVFKGSEFKLTNVNELFSCYGSFSFADFLKEYEGIEKKYVVIDSAEKLSDIEDQTIFQELLSRLLNNGWEIIFTARYSYLDDLKWQLVELFDSRSFEVMAIENISKPDLDRLGTQYGFTLPHNERFLELILTPFYLNEYLQNYESGGELKTYSEFRKLIWNKKIQKSTFRKNNIHLQREKCFLEIAWRRAASGSSRMAT